MLSRRLSLARPLKVLYSRAVMSDQARYMSLVRMAYSELVFTPRSRHSNVRFFLTRMENRRWLIQSSV